jgi:DNA-binding transcriptional ArsR family regulator
LNVILQALADPVRRTILSMLCRTPLSAGRIAGEFRISRPAVSRHLRVLREAGLVCDSQSGRERIYRFEPAPLRGIEQLLADLRSPSGTDRDAWQRGFMALETEVHRVRARRKARKAGIERNGRRRAA